MDGKPSAGSTEMWMQEHIDQLKTDAKQAGSMLDDVGAPHPDRSLKDSLAAFEAAITLAARVRGRADELNLIDQNLASYYQAKGAQDAERRQARAVFLGSLGAALQRNAASQQTAMQFPWHANCSTYGNHTTCTGD